MSKVVYFLRSRDYSVVQTEDGDYKVDARHVVTAQELRGKANRIHSQLRRPKQLSACLRLWIAPQIKGFLEYPTSRNSYQLG